MIRRGQPGLARTGVCMIGVAKIGLGERAERTPSEILQETTNEIGIGLCHGFKKISGMSIVGSVFRATTLLILPATIVLLLDSILTTPGVTS